MFSASINEYLQIWDYVVLIMMACTAASVFLCIMNVAHHMVFKFSMRLSALAKAIMFIMNIGIIAIIIIVTLHYVL